MLDYTNLNGLKQIVTDLKRIQSQEAKDVRYIKEDELDGVINLLKAIVNTKEFNEKLK
ncbi:hypothetical protein MWH28_08590 [Natroniella sulfidigena]|uniref:hypothetical protein n=1 Tax=Natroniella sulfidigena TaxID=723921 RepID=UPI00200A5367|nr:hypothetical protein [Natroniella sulfidigena]MCK8817414.1 hypothetical protein [Natroniella sulfidigena]